MCYTPGMKIIYIDRLFLINLIADYLLCLLCARFCGLYLRRLRYTLAAAVGAVFSVMTLIPACGFLNHPAFTVCCLLAMSLIAYGREEHLLRIICVFLAVCASLGGAVWAVSLHLGSAPAEHMLTLLAVFCLSYTVLSLINRGRAQRDGKHCVEARLDAFGKSCVFMALCDSGNCLRDPISGSRVMIASPRALSPVLGNCTVLFENPDSVSLLNLINDIPEFRGRFRLLPYSALAGSGLLPVFRPDRIVIDGHEVCGIMLAVSAGASGDGFEAVY